MGKNSFSTFSFQKFKSFGSKRNLKGHGTQLSQYSTKTNFGEFKPICGLPEPPAIYGRGPCPCLRAFGTRRARWTGHVNGPSRPNDPPTQSQLRQDPKYGRFAILLRLSKVTRQLPGGRRWQHNARCLSANQFDAHRLQSSRYRGIFNDPETI